MTHSEKFFNFTLNDRKQFATTFIQAIKETLADTSYQEPPMHCLPNLHQESSLLDSLINTISQLESQQSITLFRGTRLPEAISSFNINGFHATPSIEVATAYGNGITNSDTGIGRLFPTVGFLNTYDISLEQKAYKNFQYEDFTNNKGEDSSNTFHHFLEEIKSLSLQPQLFLGDSDFYTEGQKQYSTICKTYYESIIDTNIPTKHTYILVGDEHFYIEPNNLPWQKLLSRYQEICIRDFYEIKPLESILQDFNRIKNYDKHAIHTDLKVYSLCIKFEEYVKTELHNSLNAPWIANNLNDISLKQSSYIDTQSHIKNSSNIGSSNTGIINYSNTISSLIEIGDLIRLNHFTQAEQLLLALPNNTVETINNHDFSEQNSSNIKKFDTNIINNLRTQYNEQNLSDTTKNHSNRLHNKI